MTLLAILSAFVLVIAWGWFVHEVQTRRAVRERERFFEEMRRMAAAFRQLNLTMGTALMPAVVKAAAAMQDFNGQMRRAKELSEGTMPA